MNSKASCLVVLLMSLASVMIGCQGGQDSKQQKEVRVETARAEQVAGAERREYPFIATPLRESTLSFRVPGMVDRFESYAGNLYKRGSIIAEIDRRDFYLRKEQTEAVYRQAKAEFERMESLYHKNNISASAYEQARAAYVSAKTAFNKAANDLDDTRLVAPFNGYVGQTYIENYQEVKASQPVITLVDISKLRIEVYVTQEVAMAAGKLQTASLTFDHQPGKTYTARIADCARSTTANNLSYLLTILLPNPDGELSAGMSGRVWFDMDRTTGGSVAIPQTALCHQPQKGDHVWVVNSKDNTVSSRQVTAGAMMPGGMFSITKGLQAGETVATTNLRFLSEGMKVTTGTSR